MSNRFRKGVGSASRRRPLALPAAVFAQSPSPLSPTNIFAPASTPADSLFKLILSCSPSAPHFLRDRFRCSCSTPLSKFRKSDDDDGREPPQVYGSNQMELAWTVIPVLIVMVLFLATARVIHAIQDAVSPPMR